MKVIGPRTAPAGRPRERRRWPSYSFISESTPAVPCGKWPIRERIITGADHRAARLRGSRGRLGERLAPLLPPSRGGTRPETGVLSMAELVNKLPGQDPALLLKQEGVLMAGVDVSTRECDGQVVVALRGQLDMAEAAGAAAAFTAVVARGPQIIVDLAGLEFIDSSGVAALVRGRCCGCLTLTRLVDVFPVHATVAEAAGHFRRVPVLPRRR
ncbi:MAG TPA: STAS domain-containing protein, partial [Streptosporangiaceae bacterium]|nr:STAS domain-containing protein [Streptosporangiaceae bacterium]